MSIRHTVTIHCDDCGHWLHADGIDLTRFGWTRWKEGSRTRHHCPVCSLKHANQEDGS